MNLATSTQECLALMDSNYHYGEQTIHQHGIAARDNYLAICRILEGKQPDTYGLPSQLFEAYCKNERVSEATSSLYQEWHDCGKPACKSVDSEGRIHYPQHAEVSYQQFKLLFTDEEVAAELIRRDMEWHLAKNNADFAALACKPYAFTLYLTAWAEIYANASLFGGTESDGFKIRYKRLEKALKFFHE